MLNREERSGFLWFGLFGVVLAGAVVGLILQPDPDPEPRPAARASPLRLGSFGGRVVDALTGAPLAAPDVQIPALHGLSDHWLEPEDAQSPGTFRVAGLPAGGPYAVRLEVTGYEPWERSLDVAAGATLDLGEVALRPLVSMTGTVLGPDGAVRPGAQVRVLALPDGRELAATASDAQGAWRVDGIPVQAVQVSATDREMTVRRPVLADLADPRQRLDRQLVLAPSTADAPSVPTAAGPLLSGIVTGTQGQPVPHAVVTLFSEAAGDRCLYQQSASDALGRFCLVRPVPAVRAFLLAEARDHGLAAVVLDPAEAAVAVELPPERRLVLRLLAPDGQPLSGRLVELRASGGFADLPLDADLPAAVGVRRAVTDADGRATFRGLPDVDVTPVLDPDGAAEVGAALRPTPVGSEEVAPVVWQVGGAVDGDRG